MKNVFKYAAILSIMAFVFTACEENTEMDPETPDPEFNKDEILVNTYTAGDQERPQIATLTDGGWVVVWQSKGQTGSGASVFQQRYGRDGVAVGGETQVNVYTEEDQYSPQIAALAGGGWVVAWNSWGQDGDAAGVFLRTFTADGTALSEQQVNVATHLSQQDPMIAARKNGGFVVYWISQEADETPFGTMRVYHRLYDDNGNAMGGERETGGNVEGQLGSRSVTRLESGGWVASFSNAGLGTDVFQEAFNGTGSTLLSGTRVNSYTENSQYGSQVAGLEDGGWVVTWESNLQDGDGWGIYQQRFNQNGQALGGEVRVNSTTAGHQQRQRVMGLEGGGWVVVFSSGESLNPALLQQAFGPDGSQVGGQTQLNSGLIGGMNFHHIAPLDGGGWVVTWQSGAPTSGNSNVYQQAFDAGGNQRGSRSRVNDFTGGYQSHARVKTIDNGWVVVWQSAGQDGSGFGVFMKIFQMD